MDKKSIKWLTLDKDDKGNTYTQHAFKPIDKGDYIGNISLCGKIAATIDGCSPMDFMKLSPSEDIQKCCCKRCKAIYNDIDRLKIRIK